MATDIKLAALPDMDVGVKNQVMFAYSQMALESYGRACYEKARADLIAELRPVAWVRRHPDGALTAEYLEHDAIEPVRKQSGAWLPLSIIPEK